jgi:probable phosphoglycerate mutase
METRTVYLIRHGRIQQKDDSRRYIGQLDLPLNEEGLRQAQILQKRFERADIRAVYCSDLSRSQQTAEIITENKGITIIPRKTLREIDLGDWEGCKFSDIARRFPNEFKARGADIGYYRVPNGESFADCSRRVVLAFHDILECVAGNVIIVGHAGVNRLILCYLLGMPMANLFRLGQDFGCLNIIQCSGSGYHIKLINFK